MDISGLTSAPLAAGRRSRDHLKSIAEYNLRTLRASPLAELSGALGDLGTLVPLLLAMTMNRSIYLPATLVFMGLANMATGAVFGLPLPVQPMKAIAAIAIADEYGTKKTMAAGISVSLAVAVLSATGLLRWLNVVVPVPVVKGIQVGAGLSLVISAGSSMILPLEWASPGYDNRIWAVAAFLLLLLSSLFRRIPFALIAFLLGTIMAVSLIPVSPGYKNINAGLWDARLYIPERDAWIGGTLNAAIPQLPLTTLNSILAVTSLSASLFPSYPSPPTTTALGFSIAAANLAGCWYGAMPMCHGSGGLAGQYRFGARSGASVILLGFGKLLLGLLVGDGLVPLMQRFPRSLMGIMVFAAGVELAKVGQSVNEGQGLLWEEVGPVDDDDGAQDKRRESAEREKADRWMVMLITAAGCLAFHNDAVGFAAGLLWHWSLRLPEFLLRLRRRGRGYIRLSRGETETETEEGGLHLRR